MQLCCLKGVDEACGACGNGRCTVGMGSSGGAAACYSAASSSTGRSHTAVTPPGTTSTRTHARMHARTLACMHVHALHACKQAHTHPRTHTPHACVRRTTHTEHMCYYECIGHARAQWHEGHRRHSGTRATGEGRSTVGLGWTVVTIVLL